jgi:tetratricopeptide (TPR) repeat protein
LVQSGNTLYSQGQYDEAAGQYDKALTENPRLDQARFNKADAFYRLDDLAKAIELYNDVSARSKDMGLVSKAKYNLGNAHFQRGLKQKDSDLQKALDDLKTSIGYWRAVLDLDPGNVNAQRNKEVAGLVIKDILDQIKKQQEQRQSDPNQAKPDPNQQDQQSQQGGEKEDPNQSQEDGKEKQQGQDPNQAKDPNQNPKPETNNPQPDKNQQVTASDMTAQEILDKEQQQKKDRQMQVKARRIPVDKDW